MSMRINIENILKSHRSLFDDIIAKLQAKNLSNAKKILEEHNHTFDQTLFDAIDLTLQELKKEESLISRVLYRSFGIGKEKNKRREHLIIFGSELKSQLAQEKKYQIDLHQHQENLENSYKNLERLRKALKNKATFLVSDLLRERCYEYIQEIDKKIEEISALQGQLYNCKIEIRDIIKVYTKQLKKIPRYYELREDEYNEKLLESL
jgi:hypothetical protein